MKWICQWFILAIWKALESIKDGKKVIVLWIIDQNYGRFVVVLDHFRNFKGIPLIMEYNIENEEGILIQGKGNYCSKLKKWKLKTKKLLKITRYIKWTRALSNISRASPKLRKYVFTLAWKGGITASISENKYLLGSMPERIPSNNIWK